MITEESNCNILIMHDIILCLGKKPIDHLDCQRILARKLLSSRTVNITNPYLGCSGKSSSSSLPSIHVFDFALYQSRSADRLSLA